jgi:DNA polymerase III sliding clamp (beta) subunit (PCNA family)
VKRTVKETRPGVDHDADTAVIQAEGLLTGFTLTTGNGKSLAHQKLAATAVGSPPVVVPLPLIPDAAMRTIASLLAKAGPAVRIGFSFRNHVQVEIGDTTVLARLSEGRFVTWRPFLAQFPEPTGSVVMPCGTLKLAVAAAVISVDEETRRIELAFLADPYDPPAGSLILSAASSRGEADVQEWVEWVGDPVEVSIDPQYIQNMLETLGDTTPITVSLYPGQVPLKLTTEDGFLGLSQLMGETS